LANKKCFFELLDNNLLSENKLRELAYETGFMKRHAKKIDAPDLLMHICLESLNGSPSYNDLAARIDITNANSVSKQAICKRSNDSCVLFFQAVLSCLIKSKITGSASTLINECDKFKRVLIQDSTIIKLPLRLFNIFSGVSNLHSASCNIRIQCVYELLTGHFLSFSIDPYSKNDAASAPELEIQEGDLVLRDRGYLTNAEVKRHIDSQADCIYRHKQNYTYRDPITDKIINLTKRLKCKKRLNIEVCLNDKYRTKIRILAEPVSEKIANERRRKAKREMRGHNPSTEILLLMSWTIFITTISDKDFSFSKILSIYNLRWKIENIFKTWKSCMNFDRVHNVSQKQLIILLTARLIMIVICTHHLFNYYYVHIQKKHSKDLSMMKFINYLMKNIEILILLLSNINKTKPKENSIILSIVKYCSYDSRKRQNMMQMITFALS